MELPDVRHRLAPADDRELSLVPVAEGAARPAGQVALDDAQAVYSPIWIATGQMPGSVPPSWWLKAAASPRTKTSGWPGMVQSGSTIARPIAVERRAERLWSSGLAVLPAAQMTVCVGMTHPAASTDPGRMSVTSVSVRTSTPSRRSFVLGLVAQLSRVGGQEPRSALEQHHRGLAGIDVAEVAPQRVAPDLGDRARHLDAGRPAAHDDEGEVGVAAHRVGLPLGRSKASRTRRRISSASSRLLSPGASGSHSSWPK